MAKLKKKISVSFLAFIMLLACIVSGGLRQKKAEALSPSYVSGTSNTVYYFSDSAPILSQDDIDDYVTDMLMTSFYGFNVIYDVDATRTASSICALETYGYFQTQFGQNCIAIVQIQNSSLSTLRQSGVLSYIFEDLHDGGAKVLFISKYDSTEYSLGELLYVDRFLQADKEFELFLANSVKDMADRNNGDWSDKNIFLDGRYFDSNLLINSNCDRLATDISPEDFCTYYFHYVYQSSGTLQYLIDELGKQADISYASDKPEEVYSYDLHDLWINYYVGVVDELSNMQGMRLLAHVSGNSFVDVLTAHCYSRPTGEDAREQMVGTHDDFAIDEDNTYVIGNWYLETDFYDFLYYYYDDETALDIFFPIYIFEIDPIEFSDDGLPIITDSQLREWWSPEATDWDDVVAVILELQE